MYAGLFINKMLALEKGKKNHEVIYNKNHDFITFVLPEIIRTMQKTISITNRPEERFI